MGTTNRETSFELLDYHLRSHGNELIQSIETDLERRANGDTH